MNENEQSTLLLAMQFEPAKVIELIQSNWSELKIDYINLFENGK